MKIKAGLTKERIRSKILLRLKAQKEDTRDKKSKLIKAKLLMQHVFKKAKNVMFYISFGGEVKTEEMIKTAKRLGKIVLVPVCEKDRMNLRPAILDDHAALQRGPYGVREPAEKKYVCLKALDLVIVPGLAFDKKGKRLGRGKGYYDRFLRRIPPETPSIGLAFNFQILPLIPTKAHDIGVHKIIFA